MTRVRLEGGTRKFPGSPLKLPPPSFFPLWGRRGCPKVRGNLEERPRIKVITELVDT